MSQFQSVLLPKLKDSDDETEVRKMGQDILVKLNQLGDSVPTLRLDLLKAAPSSNTTVTLPSAPGFYTVYIPDNFLVAQTGGPYLLTITTGKGDNSVIPISASGDTIISGNLIFDIYVDSSGNVTPESWSISGSNSNGAYVKSSNKTMRQTGRTTIANGGTINFPVSFLTGTVPIAEISLVFTGTPAGAYAINGEPTVTSLSAVNTNGVTAEYHWQVDGYWIA